MTPGPMLIACRDCATIQTIAPATGRGRLECCRCGRVLESTVGRGVDAALACSIATLLLLLPADVMTVMTVHFHGIDISTHLVSGLGTAWDQGWYRLRSAWLLWG